MKIATLNVRSLGGKFSAVSDLITDHQLDVLSISESWHQDTDDVPVLRSAPPGYRHIDVCRPRTSAKQPRVGGVIIYFRDHFVVKKIESIPQQTTFEFVCASFSTPSGPVIVVCIYRPGSSLPDSTFFNEFSTFLEIVATFNSKLVITGDLNIHLEDDLDPHCIQFNRLLESCALKQHVNSPTHEKGGWLDVIITRTDSNVIDLHVEPPTLSDHGLIYCTVPTACPASPVFVTRQVRGWSRLDRDAFRDAIRSGPLCHDDEFYKEMKVTELFDLYNSTLRDLLDKFLPLHKVKSRYQPTTPWFDADCRRIKRQVRLLERRYRRSKSDVDRLAWVNASRDKQSTFKEKENSYWEGRIAADASNPRKLWNSLSALLGRREQTKSTAPSSFTAADYLLFIEEKVDAVRRDTEGSQPPTFDPVDCSLLSFKQCSMEDLSLIISSSAAKSCSLDPVPTSLVKENLEVLLPFLNRLCNASINEGCLPPSQKEAIVTPVLKKHGLDSSDMKNFRPVSNLSFMSKIVEKVVAKQLTSTSTATTFFQSSNRDSDGSTRLRPPC